MPPRAPVARRLTVPEARPNLRGPHGNPTDRRRFLRDHFRTWLIAACASMAFGCGSGEPERPGPQARPRCFEMSPFSVELLVDSAAVADTLADVIGVLHAVAEFDLELIADTMTTTVRTRRTTLPDSLARVVERLVDWNAMPAPRREPPTAPELVILETRDTARPPVHVLSVAMADGVVRSMAAAPGTICQPRLINGAQIMSAMAESGVLALHESARTVIRVYIDPEGTVFHTEVVHASGNPGFDALARGLALSALFEPASMHGRPIPIMSELPFELRAGRRR